MFRLTKLFAFVAASAALATQMPAASQAEIRTPHVFVPVAPPAPQVPGFAGSWQVQGLLYDRFGLNVWLNRYGSGGYTARIGWERCSGDLNWRQLPGNQMLVDLSSSRCNGPSGAWTADRMICKPAGGYYDTRIADPGPARGQKLSCTYLPGSGYYGPTHVSLRRT